jgi:ubiquinone/menaquinone biosynthesis C-methylase UbiE
MLSRVLEPEVMDTVAEAEDYNAMDHSHVNRVFVDDFLTAMKTIPQPWRIFDAGTGTALIPIELMQRDVAADITAADLAEQMLIVARRNLAVANSSESIRLVRCDCKRLDFGDASFDAVISNSIIHHIPEPFAVLKECWRILRPGGVLFIRDLLRPNDEHELEYLVVTYAGTANQHGQQMFRDSLHAALTIGEVTTMSAELGIAADAVRATSDRHWTLSVRKP